jgi:hypothetical protein
MILYIAAGMVFAGCFLMVVDALIFTLTRLNVRLQNTAVMLVAIGGMIASACAVFNI